MKIAICGYGLEGQANYRYFKDLYPDAEFVIVDESSVSSAPIEAELRIGENIFETGLADVDLAIRSPGISPKKLKTNAKIWSATNEFFGKCQNTIIGITGSKGKGTTASLIAEILRASGKTVHLIGNIGVPALEVLSKLHPGDIVVYELSSFQLWDIEYSPHIAVLLGIEADHLDVHDDLADYLQAKANITKFQTSTDRLIFNQNNQYASEIAKTTAATLVPYPRAIDEFADSLQIPGRHNQENLSAAILATEDFIGDVEAINRGISQFKGLPHRLKFVREVDGVKYYDDSIATTPGSAIAAINSFEEPKILILGGHDKGADYRKLIEKCRDTDTKIIAIGENGEKIQDLALGIGVESKFVSGNMPEIVKQASAFATLGSIVILSPAASSFDMFSSYADRGEQFIAAVNNL